MKDKDNRKKLQQGGASGASAPPSAVTNPGATAAPAPTAQNLNANNALPIGQPVTNEMLKASGVQNMTEYSGYQPGTGVFDDLENQQYDEFGIGLTDWDKGKEFHTDVQDNLFHLKDIDEGGGWAKFKDYMPDQLGARRGIDHRLKRAEAQTTGEQIGRALVQTVGGVPLGILENVGRLGTFFETFGGDYDYSNAITEFAEKHRKTLSENNAIYMEDPNATFAFGDNAWWITHAQGLFESIGEFAALGYGVGTGAMATAQRVSTALKMGATAGRDLSLITQVGTSSSLAFTEGALSGSQVYQEIMKKAFREGKTAEEAQKIAAEAATQTVRMNTAINTVLNMSSLNPMFSKYGKYLDDLSEANKKALKHKVGQETFTESAERIKGLKYAPEKYAKAKTLGKEGLQEAGEEVVNVWSEAAGRKHGEDLITMTDSEYAQYKEGKLMTKFLDVEAATATIGSMFTEEGALSAMLGAFGGIGQTLLLEHAPTLTDDMQFRGDSEQYRMGADGKEVQIRPGETMLDAQGKAIKEQGFFGSRLTTKAQKANIAAEVAFNRVKLDIAEDLLKVEELTQDLGSIMADGDMDPVQKKALIADKQEQLFNLNSYNAIHSGTGENFKSTFEHIAGINNTELLSTKAVEQTQTLEKELAQLKQNPEQYGERIATIEQEIAELEPLTKQDYTQAMKLGLAESPTDNAYKTKAENAVKDISFLMKEHDDIMANHNYGDAKTHKFARALFQLRASTYNAKKALAVTEKNIDSYRSDISQLIAKDKDNAIQGLGEAVEYAAKERALEKKILKHELEFKALEKDPNSHASKKILNAVGRRHPSEVMYAATEESKAKAEGRKPTTTVLDTLFELYAEEQLAKVKEISEQLKTVRGKKGELIARSAKLAKYGLTEEEEADLGYTSKGSIQEFETNLSDRMKAIENYQQDALTKEFDDFYEAKENIKSDEAGFADLTNKKGRDSFIKASEEFWANHYSKAEENLGENGEPKPDPKVDPNDPPKPDPDPDPDPDGDTPQDAYERTRRQEEVVKKEQDAIKEFLNFVHKKYHKTVSKSAGAKTNAYNDGSPIVTRDEIEISMAQFLKALAEFQPTNGAYIGDMLVGYESMLRKNGKNGTKIRIVRAAKKEGFAWFNSANHITFNLNASHDNYIHADAFRKAIIHESVHAATYNKFRKGNPTESQKKFYNELQGVLHSMAGEDISADFSVVMTKLLDGLKADIDKAGGPQTVSKEVDVLRSAYSALKYVKETYESRPAGQKYAGIEELITQAMEAGEFAQWLAMQKTPVKNAEGEVVGNVSFWARIKEFLLSMVKDSVDGNRLEEIAGILDRYIPDYGFQYDEKSIVMGEFTYEGTPITITGVSLGGLIKFESIHDAFGDNETMTVEKYFAEIANGKLVNNNGPVLSQMLESINTSTLEELIDSKEGYKKAKLVGEDHKLLMDAYDKKFLELTAEKEATLVAQLTAEIENMINISELPSKMARIEAITDGTHSAELKKAVGVKVRELVSEDNAMGAQVYDTKTFQPFFTDTDMYEMLMKIVEEELFSTATALNSQMSQEFNSADPSLDSIKAWKQEFDSIITAFDKVLDDKTRKTRQAKDASLKKLHGRQWKKVEDIKTAFKNDFVQSYNKSSAKMTLHNKHTAVTDENGKVLRPAARNARKLVQLIKFQNGKNITHGKKDRFNTIYEVVEDNGITSILLPLDVTDTPSKYIEVSNVDIYNFQGNLTPNENHRENVWAPEFMSQLYIHQYDKAFSIEPNTAEVWIRALFTVLDSDSSDFAKDDAAKELRNMIGYKKRKKVNDIIKAMRAFTNAEGRNEVSQEDLDAILKDWGNKLSMIEFTSEVKFNTQAAITRTLWSLKKKFGNDFNLADHIKIELSTDISVDLNKQLESSLRTDANELTPMQKLEKGLMHANPVKQASGKPFIAIHNWMQTDVGIWLDTGQAVGTNFDTLSADLDAIAAISEREGFGTAEHLKANWQSKKGLLATKVKQAKALLKQGIVTGKEVRAINIVLNDIRAVLNEGIDLSNEKALLIEVEEAIAKLAEKVLTNISNDSIAAYIEEMNDRMKSVHLDNAVGQQLVQYTGQDLWTLDGKNVEYFLNKEVNDQFLAGTLQGTERTSWFYIGNPQNPAIYHKVAADKQSSIPYHPGIILNKYNKTTDSSIQKLLLEEFNELYSDASGKELEYDDLVSLGTAANEQAALWEVLHKLYEEQDKGKIGINPETLQKIVDISYTGGGFNFNMDMDNRLTVKEYFELEAAKKFMITDKPIIIDLAQNIQVQSDLDAYVSASVGKTLREMQRGETMESLGIKESLRDITGTMLSAASGRDLTQVNRYWMLMKDVTGKIRPIALKPKRMTETRVDEFLDDIKLYIADIRAARKGEDGRPMDMEYVREIRDNIELIMKGKNKRQNSTGLFFKLSKGLEAKFDFNWKFIEALKNNEDPKITLDSFSLQIKKKEKGGKYSNTYVPVNIANAKSFIGSLKAKGYGHHNLGTRIPKITTHADFQNILEVPTHPEMFQANTISMKLKKDVEGTEDIEVEEVVDEVVDEVKDEVNENNKPEKTGAKERPYTVNAKKIGDKINDARMKGMLFHLPTGDTQIDDWLELRNQILDKILAGDTTIGTTSIVDYSPAYHLSNRDDVGKALAKDLLVALDIVMSRDVKPFMKKAPARNKLRIELANKPDDLEYNPEVTNTLAVKYAEAINKLGKEKQEDTLNRLNVASTESAERHFTQGTLKQVMMNLLGPHMDLKEHNQLFDYFNSRDGMKYFDEFIVVTRKTINEAMTKEAEEDITADEDSGLVEYDPIDDAKTVVTSFTLVLKDEPKHHVPLAKALNGMTRALLADKNLDDALGFVQDTLAHYTPDVDAKNALYNLVGTERDAHWFKLITNHVIDAFIGIAKAEHDFTKASELLALKVVAATNVVEDISEDYTVEQQPRDQIENVAEDYTVEQNPNDKKDPIDNDALVPPELTPEEKVDKDLESEDDATAFLDGIDNEVYSVYDSVDRAKLISYFEDLFLPQIRASAKHPKAGFFSTKADWKHFKKLYKGIQRYGNQGSSETELKAKIKEIVELIYSQHPDFIPTLQQWAKGPPDIKKANQVKVDREISSKVSGCY